MKNTKKFSLKFYHKLILALGVVGFSPLFLSVLFSSFLMRDYLEKNASSNLQMINRIVRSGIEDLMVQGFNNTLVLAQNPILTSPETSVEEKKKELDKIYRYYQLFDDITILDKKGRVIVSSAYRFYGRWETNAWFLKAREEKKIVASDIYAVVSAKEPILAFFAPVLDKEGKINFFVVTQVDLDAFFRLLNAKVGERGRIFLINSWGDIIVFPQRELLFEKISPDYPLKENSALKTGITTFSFQGEKFIAAFEVIEKYYQYPGHNWHLIVAQPEKEVFAIWVKTRNQIYFFSFIVLFLILLFSFILSLQISRPLKEIVFVSKEVIKGNLDVQVKIKSKDEFGELGQIFNEMIKKLKQSLTALEDSKKVLEIRIKARTRELEELNKNLEQMVEERTRELQEKIAELEAFHRLAVGRELKMIELKEKIEELQKELKKYQK